MAWNSSTTMTSLASSMWWSSERMSRAPGLGQHPLAMAQLGTQAQHGALGLAFIEIGDDARHMRQVADRLEGRTALEVDEEERNPVGGIRAGEPRQPREQEFALAAARRTGDECVRTVLHEIDDERPVPCRADRDRERRPR